MARSCVMRILITVFMLFHMFTFAVWTAPYSFALTDKYKESVRPYLLWTGIFQAWDLFAPDPSRLNGYLTATITMRDGTTRTWTEPRMDRLSYVERYQKERYRKYMTEHLWLDAQAPLWPDAAQHLARMYDTDPANPPVNVSLTRHWSLIEPPGPDGEYRSTPPADYTYFHYEVKQGDLE